MKFFMVGIMDQQDGLAVFPEFMEGGFQIGSP